MLTEHFVNKTQSQAVYNQIEKSWTWNWEEGQGQAQLQVAGITAEF